MKRPAGTDNGGSSAAAGRCGTPIRCLVAIALAGPLTSDAAFSQVAPAANVVAVADRVSVTVSPDAGNIEKGLTGTHSFQIRAAVRSKTGQSQIEVGCVPCFNIFLSFALANGRLYAMNWQTDSRRDRYRAAVNGQAVTIEAMNGLRGRDWLDAFGEIDRVPGCARDLAKGKDLDAVLKRGVCLVP
jgi:hypothetical protein